MRPCPRVLDRPHLLHYHQNEHVNDSDTIIERNVVGLLKEPPFLPPSRLSRQSRSSRPLPRPPLVHQPLALVHLHLHLHLYLLLLLHPAHL